MANVTEYLIKLQELTQTNLDILQAINDSFFTDKNHLSVSVANAQYVLPSFMSLENKINMLNENFNNLIHSPETGEAYFCIDGNSRSIELKPYTSAPNPVNLSEVSKFEVEQNDIFKDFLTPVPYVNLDLNELADDITTVLVKKVIPIKQNLKSTFKELLGDSISKRYNYSELYKVLSIYEEDKDYVMYDTKSEMPLKKSVGNGVYVVSEVEDSIDRDLNEFIKVKLRTDLDPLIYMNRASYKLFDETIERDLSIGDKLVTYEGTAKLEIVNILPDNTLMLKVLNGEYTNIIPSTGDDINNSSKLKFFSANESDDKYVKIPLEEDELVFIAVAPINNRLNIQSSWGTGLMINTHKLTGKDGEKFEEYYWNNVKNIGDILKDLSFSIQDSLSNHSPEEINNKFIMFEPELTKDDLMVAQVNKYVTKADSFIELRNNYAEKLLLREQLSNVQSKLLTASKEYSAIPFEEVSVKSAKKSEVDLLRREENNLLVSNRNLSQHMQSLYAKSNIPLEAAKYSVIGFFNIDNETLKDIEPHIVGLEVLYKYVSPASLETHTLYSINEKPFDDWNLEFHPRDKVVKYKNNKLNTVYDTEETHYHGEPYKPSFTQINIPINKWENVAICVRLVYDFNYPFIKIKSKWSKPITIAFPDEFKTQTDVTDIINENDKELEEDKFISILEDKGIYDHMNDKLEDVDSTYYHRPEHISSGFYTEERRIIPLKDKLEDMNKDINLLLDEVMGAEDGDIEVTVDLNGVTTKLIEGQTQNIYVEQYSTFLETGGKVSGYVEHTAKNEEPGYQEINVKYITTTLNICIRNNSDRNLKLYPIIPGGIDTPVNDIHKGKFDKYDYCCEDNYAWNDDKCGVWMSVNGVPKIQRANQYLTFRVRDLYTFDDYYINYNNANMKNPSEMNDVSSMYKFDMNFKQITDRLNDNSKAFLYPSLKSEYQLSITEDKYKLIRNRRTITIPVTFEYHLKEGEEISKLLSFDIRTSLYADPINYTFRVNAKYESDALDKSIAIGDAWLNNKNDYNPIWAGNISSTIK